jgi:hypothetical protein
LRRSVHLKLELAIRGVRVAEAIACDGTLAAAVVDAAGGTAELELLLPGDVSARCSVVTGPLTAPTWELGTDRDRFVLRRVPSEEEPDGDESEERIEVAVVPPPSFYSGETGSGRPMRSIASVHAGYLAIDPSGLPCPFAAGEVPCRLCATRGGASGAGPASIEDVLEVTKAAFEEGAAEFVYFNTSRFEAEDGGFAFLEPYVAAVRKHFDTLVAVRAFPPRDPKWIDRTYASGADALSYAIEIHDTAVLDDICPRRREIVSRERYDASLAHAARVFPSGTVWSDLVVGLDSLEATRAGIDSLTSMGVLPVLSLAYPRETERAAFPEPEEIAPLYAHLYAAVREARINVQHMRDLDYAITPIEARFFADEGARLDVAVSGFYRSKLGARAVRGLSRLRRRLRVRRVSESFDSSHL